MNQATTRASHSLQVTERLAPLVGENPCFLEAVRRLPTVASGEATVLVTGETGTGKELVARAIHLGRLLKKHRLDPGILLRCA